MLGWSLLAIFLLFIAWLLWAPMRLYVDSQKGLAQLDWRPLLRLRWDAEAGLDRLQLQLFFYHKTVHLGGKDAAKPTPERKTDKPAALPRPRRRMPLRRLWRLLRNTVRSFRVRKFYLAWDSDDFIWNARWYPLAAYLSRQGNAVVDINFQGRRELVFLVENRLGRMIWAIITSRF